MQGEVVIVTGAARGVGRHIAKSFAQAGARLVVADVGSTDQVASEIRELDAEVIQIAADVRDEDQVRSLMEQANRHFGQIDVLVNNAGIVPHFNWGVPRWPKIKDMEQSFWERVLGTNLGGTFLCTKHVLPYMEARRSGHVVSLYGGGSGPGACPYVVSKEAIKVFTSFVAVEEQEANVCVVSMSPGGAIATEDAPEEAQARMLTVDTIGNRFVLAGEAPMEMSGHLLDMVDGRLVIDK